MKSFLIIYWVMFGKERVDDFFKNLWLEILRAEKDFVRANGPTAKAVGWMDLLTRVFTNIEFDFKMLLENCNSLFVVLGVR